MHTTVCTFEKAPFSQLIGKNPDTDIVINL